MIIKDIKLKTNGNRTTLSADCKIRKFGWDTVYFCVDSDKKGYLVKDASPFAAVLLLPSMQQGEKLVIKGSISKQLYAGMHAIMEVVSKWDVGLNKIEIEVDNLTDDKLTPTKTASFFSGGVDSFYTYLKHKDDKKKADRIDSFIFVNSFDIDPRNIPLKTAALEEINEITKQEGVELITVDTNVRKLLDPIMPGGDMSHGGILAAIGLMLRKQYKRIYIPATFPSDLQIPWGSHMDVDTHWSTEKLSFIHDGTDITRNQKVEYIAKYPIALDHLRVCYENKAGKYNCGTCDKCLRTMITLYAVGALEKTKTFPHTIDRAIVEQGTAFKGAPKTNFLGEIQNIDTLKEFNKDKKLQASIQKSVEVTKANDTTIKSKLKGAKHRLEYKVMYFDFAYTRSGLYAVLVPFLGRKF